MPLRRYRPGFSSLIEIDLIGFSFVCDQIKFPCIDVILALVRGLSNVINDLLGLGEIETGANIEFVSSVETLSSYKFILYNCMLLSCCMTVTAATLTSTEKMGNSPWISLVLSDREIPAANNG